MKDKRSQLAIALKISTPEYGEIFKKAMELGLDTANEMDSALFGYHLFCLKDFYPEKGGYLKPEFFDARMEFLYAAGRPSWDNLWEDKSKLYVWSNYNLIFRELFKNKNGEEFILVFSHQDDKWQFNFEKLNEYKFSEKDMAVCLA